MGFKMELINKTKDVKVEWVDLGEGYSGYYDPNDPEDDALLRFDVSVWRDGEWQDPGDASYCTLIPVDTPEDILMNGLRMIMQEVEEPLRNGYSIKKICEQLSWIRPWEISPKEKRGTLWA